MIILFAYSYYRNYFRYLNHYLSFIFITILIIEGRIYSVISREFRRNERPDFIGINSSTTSGERGRKIAYIAITIVIDDSQIVGELRDNGNLIQHQYTLIKSGFVINRPHILSYAWISIVCVESLYIGRPSFAHLKIPP